MFTEDELRWMYEMLDDYVPGEISPTYYYKKKLKKNEKQIKGMLEMN